MKDLLTDRKAKDKAPSYEQERYNFERVLLIEKSSDEVFKFCYDRNQRTDNEQFVPVKALVNNRYRNGWVIFTHEEQEGGGYEMHVSRVIVKR